MVRRTVLLEFPDMAALKAFYDAPEYAPLKAQRMASANTDVLVFEGV